MQNSIQFNEILTGINAHNPDKADYLAFIFHGYGADFNDLLSIADLLTPEGKTIQWIFPNGIYEVPIGPGWTGRAWWPLTMTSLPHDWSNITPPGLEALKDQVFNLIQSFKTPWSKIILGGFSQGAMLATELYLSAPETPKTLLSFSGTLIRKDVWNTLAANRKSERVFLSHGEQDPVLPSAGTQKLIQLFKSHAIDCDFSSFMGGHEIPLKALQKAQKHLTDKL